MAIPALLKRSRSRLTRKGNTIVSRALRAADELYQHAKRTNSPDDWKDCFQAYSEMLPYIKPKLQAIAGAILDDQGDLTPLQIRHYADQIEQYAQKETDAIQIEGSSETSDEGTGKALQGEVCNAQE